MSTLTVCGSAGSYPGRGRACSSYLLADGPALLLLDIGSGSLANLQRWVSLQSITDIFVSHDHLDHMADLIGLLQFTSFSPDRQERLRVWAHPDTCQTLRALQRQFAPSDRSLELRPVEPGQDYELAGGQRFRVMPAVHSRPAYSIRVTDSCGQVIAYTGDTSLCDSVIECAKDADLLIAEASWPEPREDYPLGVHMTGEEAGELAQRANARRLLVTHVWPEFEPGDSMRAAQRRFGGSVLLAEDNLVIRVAGDAP